MNYQFQILIVDDEPNIRSGLAKGLANHASLIEQAGNVNEAIDKFNSRDFQLVIADVRLPGDRNGLDFVSYVRQVKPETTSIVITAHGTVDTAVEAMRRGAFDFITKPIDLNLIREQVSKAAEHHRLQVENRDLKDSLAQSSKVAGIIGNCRTLKEVIEQIRQVAETDATVLIQGESGTGKELIAQAVHDLSGRSANRFVPVNLGALPETLLESELFGHEKGSFTGAARRKPGCFEQANSGTLFIDEVTEIPPKCQVDLLRILETGQFTRVGGEETLKSNARIVSATNRDIAELVQVGEFREDLYYRLNIVPIVVPPLRHRRQDIPLLVEHFLRHFCERHKRELKSIQSEALVQLSEANWPGNIRQLRNVIERLVVTVSNDEISIQDLPADFCATTGPVQQSPSTLAAAVEAAEKEAILNALKSNDFHRERTANSLDISVRSLHYKMNRYELH